MRDSNRRPLFLGLAGGAGAAACVAFLMGQSGTQPGLGQRGQEYFVTGEGTQAYLWQREGTLLRFVSQADTSRMPPGRDPARPMDPTRPGDPNRPADPINPDRKPGDPK